MLIDNRHGEFILPVEEYQKDPETLFVKYQFRYDSSLGLLDFRKYLEKKVMQRAKAYCADKGGLYTIKSRTFYPIDIARRDNRLSQLIEADLTCSDEPWDMQ